MIMHAATFADGRKPDSTTNTALKLEKNVFKQFSTDSNYTKITGLILTAIDLM